MFIITCADLHTCHLFSYVTACLPEQRRINRQEQLPLFTFKDLLLADDERYAAAIRCEHLDAGEASANLCFLVCPCYIRGVLNMGTLYNGLKCLPGKMD